MDQDKFQKFLDGTFEPERQHVRKRAIANHRTYNGTLWAIAGLSLISALAIAIEAFLDVLALKIIAAVASIFVTTLTGTLKIRDYQEKANRYTRLLNDLNTEWDFYQAHAEQYAKADDLEQLFVARVRLLLNEAANSIPNMTIPASK
jgi:SMODS and SLOG-associating 2TM effector domain 1